MMSDQKCRQRVRAPRSASGAIAVEFAFVLILLLLILSGIVEFGRAMWHSNVLTKATRDGARVMSAWEPADLANGRTEAVTRVVVAANASRISPQLTDGNVVLECDYSTGSPPAFEFGACTDDSPPVSVRVRIVDYQFKLGEWVPFLGFGGVLDLGWVTPTPRTVMLYMKEPS